MWSVTFHMGYSFIGEVNSENKHWLSINIYKINFWRTHLFNLLHTHTYTSTSLWSSRSSLILIYIIWHISILIKNIFQINNPIHWNPLCSLEASEVSRHWNMCFGGTNQWTWCLIILYNHNSSTYICFVHGSSMLPYTKIFSCKKTSVTK